MRSQKYNSTCEDGNRWRQDSTGLFLTNVSRAQKCIVITPGKEREMSNSFHFFREGRVLDEQRAVSVPQYSLL